MKLSKINRYKIENLKESNFDYKMLNNLLYKKKKDKKFWKKVCTEPECVKLTKTQNNKCLKHSRGFIINKDDNVNIDLILPFKRKRKTIKKDNLDKNNKKQKLNKIKKTKTDKSVVNKPLNQSTINNYTNDNINNYTNDNINNYMNYRENVYVDSLHNFNSLNVSELNSKYILFLTSEMEHEIYLSWFNYTMKGDDNYYNRCQGSCCSFDLFLDDTDRLLWNNTYNKTTYCEIEKKYLCNLCKIF
jgi:hypothetical protein